jgi:hypothetical protein
MTASDGIRFAGYPDGRERLGFAYELRHRVMPTECDDCAARIWLVSNGPGVPVPGGFTVVETRNFPGIAVYFLRATPT